MTLMEGREEGDSFDGLHSPGLLRLALEWRLPWECGAMMAALPILWRAPRGDGHPVVVFPGLLAHDATTWALRRYLHDRGYDAHPWGEGFNLGPDDELVARFAARVGKLRAAAGMKVSLIGWSLGGVYAREVAKAAADDVRCVITLASPFTGHPKANNAWRIFEIASKRKVAEPKRFAALRRAPPVPTTSIYSKSDGIVAWQCSLEKAGPQTENIEVESSHCGMGMNPLALYAIADRLAQPEGSWRPFERRGLRRVAYRKSRG